MVRRAEQEYAIQQSQLRNLIENIQTSEDARAQMTYMLGTGDQVSGAGAFNQNPAVGQYTGYYDLDTQLQGDLMRYANRWTFMEADKQYPSNVDALDVHEKQKAMNAAILAAKPYRVTSKGEYLMRNTKGAGDPNLSQEEIKALIDAKHFATDAYTSARKSYNTELKEANWQNINQANAWRNNADGMWGSTIDNLNSLMREAEEAARSGDMTRAAELKSQAEDLLKGLPAEVQRAINLRQDPKDLATSNLSNPTARIVGGMIKESLEMQDRDSGAYIDMFKALTTDSVDAINSAVKYGERVIAAEQRTIERGTRDLALRRGNARNVYAESAIMARASDQAAFRRAQLATEAAVKTSQVLGQGRAFMEQFRIDYGTSSVALGQALIDNSPGVRDAFNGIIANIASAQAAGYQNAGNQWYSGYLQAQALKAQQGSKTGEIVNMAAGGLGTVVGVVGAAFCWAAAEYFGWGTYEWYAARHWILNIWKGPIANVFRRFYIKHGKKLAWVIRHFPPVKMALRPFFEHAAREGAK